MAEVTRLMEMALEDSQKQAASIKQGAGKVVDGAAGSAGSIASTAKKVINQPV